MNKYIPILGIIAILGLASLLSALPMFVGVGYSDYPKLLAYGFVLGLGFSIAVLIMQYLKNHLRLK